jgi:hypothetical protein
LEPSMAKWRKHHCYAFVEVPAVSVVKIEMLEKVF